jgi:hypothetical protein
VSEEKRREIYFYRAESPARKPGQELVFWEVIYLSSDSVYFYHIKNQRLAEALKKMQAAARMYRG